MQCYRGKSYGIGVIVVVLRVIVVVLWGYICGAMVKGVKGVINVVQGVIHAGVGTRNATHEILLNFSQTLFCSSCVFLSFCL